MWSYIIKYIHKYDIASALINGVLTLEMFRCHVNTAIALLCQAVKKLKLAQMERLYVAALRPHTHTCTHTCVCMHICAPPRHTHAHAPESRSYSSLLMFHFQPRSDCKCMREPKPELPIVFYSQKDNLKDNGDGCCFKPLMSCYTVIGGQNKCSSCLFFFLFLIGSQI